MRIHVLVNAKSGKLIDQQLDTEGLVRTHLGPSADQLEVRILEPAKLNGAFEEALGVSVDRIIVGGGDGTARSAAAKLLADGGSSHPALGIWPLGTVNRLARDLAIPVEPSTALQALATAQPRPIDVAEVNGRIFLSNSMLGLPIRIAEERENVRGTSLLRRLQGYGDLIGQIVTATRKLQVVIDEDGERRRVRALTVVVSNNMYDEQPGLFHSRSHLDRSELGVYLSTHASGLAMFTAVLGTLLGRWRADPQLSMESAHAVELQLPYKHIRIINDGEVERYELPLTYRIRPKALTVLQPVDRATAH